ncbi:hypothetical protein MCEGE10_02662 [Flavobacteriaceae bacterium]
MKSNGYPNQILLTSLFMLFVGIIIYRNSLNKSKDSIVIRQDNLKSNFDSYFKNKGMILIVFSSLFILIYLIMFLLGRL